MAAMLEVEGITKSFRAKHRQVQALETLSFSVASGEVLAIVGPSGCGKSTTLRCVAGLEEPTSGAIRINGRTMWDAARHERVPARLRRVGMVFQSYALWPHMTVFENVAYPLKRTLERPERRGGTIASRVGAALDLVRISELASRYIGELSGGQQQRVAIARALVTDADLVLFDEPLSNLDSRLREEMRGEIRDVLTATQKTALYVTHDLEEAMAIADRVMVLQSGVVEQVGAPQEVFEQPSSLFVAQFLGGVQTVPGIVAGRCHDGITVSSDIGIFEVQATSVRVGDPVIVAIRPGALRLATSRRGRTVRGTVRSRQYRGDEMVYRTQFANEICDVVGPTYGRIFEPGDMIEVVVQENNLLLFRAEGKLSSRLDAALPSVPSTELGVREPAGIAS